MGFFSNLYYSFMEHLSYGGSGPGGFNPAYLIMVALFMLAVILYLFTNSHK